MQKEIFFTEEEMQIIRVCLHNAPIPYDQGEGAKELKKLQEKVGPPISREEPGIEKVEYDLTPYGIEPLT